MLVSCGGHVGVCCCHVSVKVGVMLGSCRSHVGLMSGSCHDHIGVMSGSSQMYGAMGLFQIVYCAFYGAILSQ